MQVFEELDLQSGGCLENVTAFKRLKAKLPTRREKPKFTGITNNESVERNLKLIWNFLYQILAQHVTQLYRCETSFVGNSPVQ